MSRSPQYLPLPHLPVGAPEQVNVGEEDTPLPDCRIEHHTRPLARAGDGNDRASRVNFSDAMIGAVGDKQASVFRDGDFLRRVELGLQGLTAVVAEAPAPRPGDGSDDARANNTNAVVAAVRNVKRARGVELQIGR